MGDAIEIDGLCVPVCVRVCVCVCVPVSVVVEALCMQSKLRVRIRSEVTCGGDTSGQGLCVLVGISGEDTPEGIDWMAKKLTSGE